MKLNKHLIEFLVAMAIIVVLAVLLIPPVQIARDAYLKVNDPEHALKVVAQNEFVQWKTLGDGLWGGNLGGNCYVILTDSDARKMSTLLAFHEAMARLIKEENLVIEKISYLQFDGSPFIYGINLIARKACHGTVVPHTTIPIPVPMSDKEDIPER